MWYNKNGVTSARMSNCEGRGEQRRSMRVKDEIADIDYRHTKKFFKNRAKKFRSDNPYSVTMYQDDNQELVKERNLRETAKLVPLMKIGPDSKVLDVACGIGRWADALPEHIREYCGIDFSEELIGIAKERNQKDNFEFYQGAAIELEEVLKKNQKGKYNCCLLIGILMYLNDEDIINLFRQLEERSEQNSMICIREPIGIGERLTLKDFFSEELKDNYNAIYRTNRELEGIFEETLLSKGYQIKSKNYLFEEDKKLNNRKETAQYYYILERQQACIKKK